MLAAFKLLPAISRLVNNITQLIRLAPSVDQVFTGLYEQEEIYGVLPDEPENVLNTKDITVSNLTFRYPKSKGNILKRINMIIPQNRSIGIVGASGAGKSTLVDIILGILPPQEGYVSFDGKSIHHHFNAWSKHVGYIPQVIYLLDDTILENVAFGVDKKYVKEDKVWAALEQAQAREFVEDLPDGLHTTVGDRGVRLSGGQRQRIGIARALYNNPSILVLDEATSSLDNETESAVMDAIHNLKGRKTLIIVAHRLSTIERCDILYEVANRAVKRIRGEL